MWQINVCSHWSNQMSRVSIVEKQTSVDKHEGKMTVANDGNFRLLGVCEFLYSNLLTVRLSRSHGKLLLLMKLQQTPQLDHPIFGIENRAQLKMLRHQENEKNKEMKWPEE